METVAMLRTCYPGVRFIMTADAPMQLCRGKNVLFICNDDKVRRERFKRIVDQVKSLIVDLDIDAKVVVDEASERLAVDDARLFAYRISLRDEYKLRGLRIDSVCIVHR